MTATFETLDALDAKLASMGRPRIFAPGSWWAEQAASFYAHPTAREWWLQVGRAGAKSTVMYRLAQNETLFGDHEVPDGERHFAIGMSKNKDEAAKGIAGIARDFTDLGVRFTLAGDCIELLDAPRGIRVVAASVGAASGWRCYFVGHDELAKLPRDGAAAVDVNEVIASARAMCVTHPRARRLYPSSPFGMAGPHYETCRLGTTEHTFVSHAPTWVANPSVSEEQTRKLERNARVWTREYAAVAVSGANAAFEPEDVEAAFEAYATRRLTAFGAPVLVLDPSAGRGDTWCWSLAQYAVELSDPSDVYLWEDTIDPRTNRPLRKRLCDAKTGQPLANPDFNASSEPILCIFDIAGLEGTFSREITAEAIVDKLAAFARRSGVTSVISDQHENYLLASAFNRRGLRFRHYDITAASKPEAYTHLQRLFRERRIAIQAHGKMRAELLSAEERYMESGYVRFGGTAAHDYASLAVVSSLHDIEGGFAGSLVAISRGGVTESGSGSGELARHSY